MPTRKEPMTLGGSWLGLVNPGLALASPSALAVGWLTSERFRRRGSQKALLKHRINLAADLGLENLYTDVEFGSVSHDNMEKLEFPTVFLNSLWTKVG